MLLGAGLPGLAGEAKSYAERLFDSPRGRLAERGRVEEILAVLDLTR